MIDIRSRPDRCFAHQARLPGETSRLHCETRLVASRIKDACLARLTVCLANQPWLLRESSGLTRASTSLFRASIPFPCESNSLPRESSPFPREPTHSLFGNVLLARRRRGPCPLWLLACAGDRFLPSAIKPSLRPCCSMKVRWQAE